MAVSISVLPEWLSQMHSCDVVFGCVSTNYLICPNIDSVVLDLLKIKICLEVCSIKRDRDTSLLSSFLINSPGKGVFILCEVLTPYPGSFHYIYYMLNVKYDYRLQKNTIIVLLKTFKASSIDRICLLLYYYIITLHYTYIIYYKNQDSYYCHKRHFPVLTVG